MADDSYEKTEEPTPKKLDDARKKGQVARSRELSTALVLISVCRLIYCFGNVQCHATVFHALAR